MVTVEDVRALALALPDTIEKVDGHRGGAGWRVHDKLFAWERAPSASDLRQLDALDRSWPDGPVIGVRTDGLDVKEALIGSFPDVFFTIPHFDGYPAVLVRLDAIEPAHLAEVVTDAWLVQAPKRTANAWLAEHPPVAP
ncbi:MmcQ/YjbR family DNA-binding protein [Microbacterium rhizomatis]|uniref:MmcQ/YjbR family DNA-binding protein n=1 Tax=Microbacterium rhizomatis TaxID=1631477 RepID=A0A5J5J1H6_9MICO|nr:MmcQ/YjbR family DNA-binding protein [Microbacterium rhizomatis]KAA9108386.1 hypothetical protein F6B43_13465 [Microbacterium rhizomatis]